MANAECLNASWIRSLADARERLELWATGKYNEGSTSQRPSAA